MSSLTSGRMGINPDPKHGHQRTTMAEGEATTPILAHQVTVNSYLVIQGRPCLVDKVSTHKSSKNGPRKYQIQGKDIFRVPLVTRKTCVVSYVEDERLFIVDPVSFETSELIVHDNVKLNLIVGLLDEGQLVQVVVISSMGHKNVNVLNIHPL